MNERNVWGDKLTLISWGDSTPNCTRFVSRSGATESLVSAIAERWLLHTD
jgi:hypothetical protein